MTYQQQPPGQQPWPPAGQPQYGQPPPIPPGYPPPPYPPGQPPKKKSRVGLTLGIVAIVLVVLCGGAVLISALTNGTKTSNSTSDNNATPPTSGPAATKAPAGPAHAGLNQPVRDGKFEFVVHSVTCGKTRVGNDVLNKSAQGQFCEVSVTVKNIGRQPQTFAGSSQKAKGTTGVSYSNDSEAEIYANSEHQTFLNEINPGNQVQGLIVFDIPKGAKIASLELHDSPFSGGVVVTVS